MAFAIESRQVRRRGPGRAAVGLPVGWTAPRLFGGMAMACALRVADLDGRGTVVPLSAAAAFHHPLSPGPTDATLTELAATRRTRAVLVRLGECLSVTATLAGVDAFAGADAGARFRGRDGGPVVPAPEELRPLPESPGRASGEGAGEAAALARHVDWRAITPWRERGNGGEVLAWLAPRRTPWIAGGYLDPLWYCVAADLLGPALYRGTPFTIATVSLDVQILGLTRNPWLLQRVTPDAMGPWAGGRIELWDRAGRLVATAAQRARLLTATPGDEPWSETAFGSGRSRPIQSTT